MCGFIAQLVEQRTGNAEVTGLNPVEALIFFRLLLSSSLKWKIYCNDHSSLSSTTAVQKWQKKWQKKNELFHILHIIDHVSCLKIFATHHETRGFTSRPGESPSRIGGLAGRKNAKKNRANIQPSWPNKTGQVAKKNTVSCTTKAALEILSGQWAHFACEVAN